MARSTQSDMFEPDAQSDLFGGEAEPADMPDPDRVRTRLHRILGEARAARSLPWDAGRTSLYRTIFPQLTLWLPDDEGAQLRLEFQAEMTRFGIE